MPGCAPLYSDAAQAWQRLNKQNAMDASALLQVSKDDQTEYLKALAERCAARQQQTEEALRQKYLKPLNPDAKKVSKAGMEEHLARLQRLFQGQGVEDRPVKG